jgi:hypothetical protein
MQIREIEQQRYQLQKAQLHCAWPEIHRHPQAQENVFEKR